MLLQDSWKAASEMTGNDMTRKQLVKVVHDFHNDVCTDGSSYVVYEYNEKSDKSKPHFKAFAGFAYYASERTVKQNLLDESYHRCAFEFGIGVETEIDRVMKGGSVEAWNLASHILPKRNSSTM